METIAKRMAEACRVAAEEGGDCPLESATYCFVAPGITLNVEMYACMECPIEGGCERANVEGWLNVLRENTIRVFAE